MSPFGYTKPIRLLNLDNHRWFNEDGSRRNGVRRAIYLWVDNPAPQIRAVIADDFHAKERARLRRFRAKKAAALT